VSGSLTSPTSMLPRIRAWMINKPDKYHEWLYGRDIMRDLKTMFSSRQMDWETPDEIFDPLNEEFGFALDAAASRLSSRCANWVGSDQIIEQDDLNLENRRADSRIDPWPGNGPVWINPPYGRHQVKWVERAAAEGKGRTVVMLIPARPDTKVWHEVIFPKAADIRFVKGRIRFWLPKPLEADIEPLIRTMEEGGQMERVLIPAPSAAPFPTAVVVFRPGSISPRVGTWEPAHRKYDEGEEIKWPIRVASPGGAAPVAPLSMPALLDGAFKQMDMSAYAST
jgi:phage N-6-adenine-methyltransferase